jgi:transposase
MCGSAVSRPVGGGGRAGLVAVSERKSYKTDLSDEQWALVEPVITAWKAAHPSVSGHQGRYTMREIVNALFYQGRTGCQWALLPHGFPPPVAVKYYFYTWRDDGTDQTIHDLLRWQVREKARRKADPSLVVLDTQSVHAEAGVPAQTTGRDAAKKYRAASAAWPLTCWGWCSRWS